MVEDLNEQKGHAASDRSRIDVSGFRKEKEEEKEQYK
jgi:hypothetical protein